jgi:hypothetical protein
LSSLPGTLVRVVVDRLVEHVDEAPLADQAVADVVDLEVLDVLRAHRHRPGDRDRPGLDGELRVLDAESNLGVARPTRHRRAAEVERTWLAGLCGVRVHCRRWTVVPLPGDLARRLACEREGREKTKAVARPSLDRHVHLD